MFRIRGVAAVAATLVLLAACGGEDRPSFDELPLLTAPPIETPAAAPTDAFSPSPTPTDPSGLPTPTATLGATAEPTGTLADGRHPVYLTAVDVAVGTITVDVVQFFTGTAATQAATEDRAAQIPPPNEIWLRNRSTVLRTLPISGSAPITVNTLSAEETGNSRKNLEVTLQKLAAYPSLEARLFYVTVSGGIVVALREQYLP
ncbi:MAG: hypothetical protein ACT4QF_15180 [Sporichthyaceae bacterium]